MIHAAVLDQDERGPIVYDPRRLAPWSIKARPIGAVADLVALADALDTWQLWIHPRWSAAHQDLELPSWSAHVGARRRVQLAAPAGDRGFGKLGDAQDGAELLGALVALQEALQTPWHGTPGRTGTDLLERDLRRSGAFVEPSLPPLRDVGCLEGDYGWIRRLTDDEQDRRYVHAFDKHSMYVVAAATVEVGIGDAELVIHPTFDARTPGYWHVRDHWDAGELLPDPSRSTPRRHGADADGFRWVTTPTAAALAYAGVLDDVAAAWIWREHRRQLGRTAQAFRNARGFLDAYDGPGAELAMAALKETYSATFGWLAMPRDRAPTPGPLFRPDWRDLVKAEARCRLWHNVRQLAERRGVVPFAIGTDCLYIASDEADPLAVVGDGLPIGDEPRQFAWKGRAPLEAIMPWADPMYRVARISRAFRGARDGIAA